MKETIFSKVAVAVPVLALIAVLVLPQTVSATLPASVDQLVSLPAIDLTSETMSSSESTTKDGNASAAAKSESKTVVTSTTKQEDKTSKECQLTIDKSADVSKAEPGDTITYTIDIENTGTADCTGGGVRIEDVLDPNLQLDDYTYTSNLSEGYGSKPVYQESDRKIQFNGHDLHPGESGRIVLITSVLTPDQCGDFTVSNKAKATAKELNHYKDWVYSGEITTDIDNDCSRPVAPTCPLSEQAGRTIIDLTGDRLRSGQGDSRGIGHEQAFSFSAGQYDVTLVGWDGYANRVSIDQPTESYFLEFLNGSTRVARSNATTDLADNTVEATVNEVVNRNLEITSEVTSVRAVHAVLPDTSSPNSINPICAAVDTVTPEPPVPTCTAFTTSPDVVTMGGTAVLTWETENATEVTIDNDLGTFGPNGFLSVAPTDTTTYTLTAVNSTHKTDTCTVKVTVKTPEKPMKPQCPLTPKEGRTIVDFSDTRLRSDRGASSAFSPITPASFAAGQYDITLVSWDGYNNRVNATQPKEQYVVEFMNGSTVVDTSSAVSDLADKVVQATNNERVNSDFTLSSSADGIRAAHAVYPDTSSPNSLEPICVAIDELPEEPLPVCESFTGTPTILPVDGGEVALNWTVTAADAVEITPAIGSVDLTGSATTSITDTTTFTLTATGANDQTDSCEVTITVPDPEPLPVCESFTASPSILPVGGGTVELNWEVFDAVAVSISPTVGGVDPIASTSIAVTESTTFELVAVNSEGEEDRCEAPVAVPDPVVFTCADNVTFTASDTSITRGQSVTLNWDTVAADSVAISQINATALTGSQSVSPVNDTTYVLTATKGNQSIECPLTVNVSTGGGGGGSSSPRCELEISDSRIEAGEEIILTWETSRTSDVVITDDQGNVVVDSNELLGDEKDDLLDGEIRLNPTRDTEYTLVAERGSRDRECSVEVEVDGDEVTVIETRDQAPLVAGISLSEVPYTGFEAGPLMTFLFYAVLLGWSLFLAYVLVVPRGTATVAATVATPAQEMKQAEAIRPDVFASVTAAPSVAPTAPAPTNLPIAAPAPASAPTMAAVATADTPVDVAALEALAHNQQALLSSDAINTFITTVPVAEQLQKMVSVVTAAKAQFPLEDGWVVINNDRMLSLLIA